MNLTTPITNDTNNNDNDNDPSSAMAILAVMVCQQVCVLPTSDKGKDKGWHKVKGWHQDKGRG